MNDVSTPPFHLALVQLIHDAMTRGVFHSSLPLPTSDENTTVEWLESVMEALDPIAMASDWAPARPPHRSLQAPDDFVLGPRISRFRGLRERGAFDFHRTPQDMVRNEQYCCVPPSAD